jgi:MscS family membrane protein
MAYYTKRLKRLNFRMLYCHWLINIVIFCLMLLFSDLTVMAITEPYPLMPPDTSSPRATMRVFIDNMNRAYKISLAKEYKKEAVLPYLDRAAKCLDLSEIARNVVQDVGQETALLLKEVFDRIETPPLEEIPDKNTVASKGLTSWTIPQTTIAIVKIKEGSRQGEFLFSSDMVTHVREFYDRVADLPYKPDSSVGAYEDYVYGPGPMIPQRWIRKLPAWTKMGVYDQALWQWFGLLVTLIVGGLITFLVFRWTRPRRADTEKPDEEAVASRWSWPKLVFPVVWMLVAFLAEYFVDEQINITGEILKFIKIFLRIVFFLASGWAIVVIGNGIAEMVISSKRIFARTIDANLVRLISRLVTLVLLCVLLWNTSDYLGMSFTAVFASAGIVGLGVALAARETLANFFGGISIFMDRPFKSGDYIVLDTGERGQVVEVGLRSTRMLTRDDIQISIPNSLMTNTKVVNESAPNPRYRVRIKVGVAYGTDVDRVEETLLTLAHNNNLVAVVPEPRVRFRNFGDSALEFELLCWAHRPEERGRLIHQLNHQIYKAFEASGIHIPFPQRDVHLHSHPENSE